MTVCTFRPDTIGVNEGALPRTVRVVLQSGDRNDRLDAHPTRREAYARVVSALPTGLKGTDWNLARIPRRSRRPWSRPATVSWSRRASMAQRSRRGDQAAQSNPPSFEAFRQPRV